MLLYLIWDVLGPSRSAAAAACFAGSLLCVLLIGCCATIVVPHLQSRRWSAGFGTWTVQVCCKGSIWVTQCIDKRVRRSVVCGVHHSCLPVLACCVAGLAAPSSGQWCWGLLLCQVCLRLADVVSTPQCGCGAELLASRQVGACALLAICRPAVLSMLVGWPVGWAVSRLAHVDGAEISVQRAPALFLSAASTVS